MPRVRDKTNPEGATLIDPRRDAIDEDVDTPHRLEPSALTRPQVASAASAETIRWDEV